MNQGPARHIAFVSPLGGTGQSTLVANVASVLAQQHWPCLAVDLCAQNQLGRHLGLRAESATGWVDHLAAGSWIGDAAWINQDGLSFLPFGEPQLASLACMEQTAAATGDWLHQQLRDMDLNPRTLLLLDAPAWPSAMALQALRDADMVVVNLDPTDRACEIQTALASMHQQMAPHARMVSVVSRFDPRRSSQQQALQTLGRQWGQQMAPYVLHEDEAMSPAWQERLCVVSHAPASQAAHDLQGITAWLLEICGLQGPESR